MDGHAESFLEMLAVERGAARNTLAAYRADLEDFAGVAAAHGQSLAAADDACLRDYLAGLRQAGLSARTAARRAERRLTALPAQGRSVRPVLRQFVNRVSDLLWLMAREAEQ